MDRFIAIHGETYSSSELDGIIPIFTEMAKCKNHAQAIARQDKKEGGSGNTVIVKLEVVTDLTVHTSYVFKNVATTPPPSLPDYSGSNWSELPSYMKHRSEIYSEYKKELNEVQWFFRTEDDDFKGPFINYMRAEQALDDYIACLEGQIPF